HHAHRVESVRARFAREYGEPVADLDQIEVQRVADARTPAGRHERFQLGTAAQTGTDVADHAHALPSRRRRRISCALEAARIASECLRSGSTRASDSAPTSSATI